MFALLYTNASRTNYLFGAALFLSFFTPVFVANAAGNLVQNGDLETVSPTSATLPLGWTTDSWGTLTAAFTYPVLGDASAKAARVDISGYSSGDAKWYYDHVKVTPGTVYQVSDNYMSNVASEVDAEYKMQDGSFSYAVLASLASTNGAWSSFSAQVTPPTGVVSMSVLHLIESNGYLVIDTVSLTLGAVSPPPPPPIATTTPPIATTTPPVATTTPPIVVPPPVATSTPPIATTTPPVATTTPPVVPPPPPPPVVTNLITNGTLESGSTNAPTAWSHDFWGSLTAKFTYPVAGKGGGKAAQLQITKFSSGAANWIFNHVADSSHTTYQFSEDYMATAPTELDIEFLMQDGTYDYEWLANVSPSNTWQTLQAQVTPPTGAVSFTVLHILAKVGTLTIDNASLSALQDPFPQGMVTFAFDDGLLSQYQNALSMLKTAGMKASFFIITNEPTSGDSGYMNWTQIKALAAAGFEVGGHTRTHAALTTLTQAQLTNEVTGSFTDLKAQGLTPKTFVYPLGDVNAAVELAVKNAGYLGARGSYFGLNIPHSDKYDLYDIRVDSSSNLATIEKYIDQAKADKRWLVFELHDIKTGGDVYAITPTFFQSLVTYIKQSGIQVATLQQGLASMAQ